MVDWVRFVPVVIPSALGLSVLAGVLLASASAPVFAQQSGLSGSLDGSVSGRTRSRLSGEPSASNTQRSRVRDPAAQHDLGPRPYTRPYVPGGVFEDRSPGPVLPNDPR